MNAIRVENLSKQYPGFFLDHINLTIPMGSVSGLIGENGAGKTTLMQLILGLINKDSGTIEVMDQSGNCQQIKNKEEIGTVLDEECFPETLNVKDIGLIMKRIYKNYWSQDAFKKMLVKFNLPENKAVKDFSKGMKMKLNIAVAMSHNAKLLILDEPTGGLDPVVRDEILDMFYDFMQDEEHSILISSHITSDLEKICDYITFIHDGKIEISREKDLLLEELGIWKGSKEELDSLKKEKDAVKINDIKTADITTNNIKPDDIMTKAIIRTYVRGFGTEALVRKTFFKDQSQIENASLEDIMLFLAKGEK